jgi:hypothetical protein
VDLHRRFVRCAVLRMGASHNMQVCYSCCRACGYMLALVLCAVSCRWCVAVDVEPCAMERQLLERLDYAANVVNNGQRRVSIAWPGLCNNPRRSCCRSL